MTYALPVVDDDVDARILGWAEDADEARRIVADLYYNIDISSNEEIPQTVTLVNAVTFDQHPDVNIEYEIDRAETYRQAWLVSLTNT